MTESPAIYGNLKTGGRLSDAMGPELQQCSASENASNWRTNEGTNRSKNLIAFLIHYREPSHDNRQTKCYSPPHIHVSRRRCYNLKIHFGFIRATHFCAIIISTSNRTLSRKSFVVFIGFQPNALPLSALQRELVPSQGP